jgi:hypothetical protein
MRNRAREFKMDKEYVMSQMEEHLADAEQRLEKLIDTASFSSTARELKIIWELVNSTRIDLTDLQEEDC